MFQHQLNLNRVLKCISLEMICSVFTQTRSIELFVIFQMVIHNFLIRINVFNKLGMS